MASRWKNMYPFVTSEWLLVELNEVFSGGNAPSENVIEIAAGLLEMAENE
jgi:hypothetical protein